MLLASGKVTVGTTLKVCVNCGDSELVYVGCEFVANVIAPDCDDVGYTRYTCSCGYYYDDNFVAPVGHNVAAFDAENVDESVWTKLSNETGLCDYIVAPIYVAICADCGTEVYETGIAIGHQYDATVTDPDCINDGYTTYTCVCGDSYVDDFVPALGHVLPEFDVDNIDPAWILDQNNSGICDCEWERTYTAFCSVCGADAHEVGTALGHVYTNYVPVLNYTDLTDCVWEPRDVAECDVCGHADCIDTIYYPALGHDWAAWTIVTAPTVDVTGVIVRVCNRSGETESMILPALSEADYTYEDDAPTCTVAGTRTYTVTVGEQSFSFAVAIPATGHVINADCAYTVTVVPTMDADGEVVIVCACGDELTYALPSLAYGRAYNIQPGNCGGVKDVYSFVVVADGVDSGECIVSFEVACAEEHSDIPAKDDCTMVEGDDKYYWVYRCDKCGLWIVAYYENK